MRLGNERPTRCAALFLMMKLATVPKRQPIIIDPMQSGMHEFRNELKETAVKAIATPVTDAVSSNKTTFKLGSPLVLTETIFFENPKIIYML